MEQYKVDRKQRMQERRERAKEKVKEMIENPHQFASDSSERMSEEELESMRKDMLKEDPHMEREESRWLWNNKKDMNNFADLSDYYDPWAQAYRMLGIYIECNGVGEQRYYYYNNNNNDDNQGCKRWVLWAAVSTIHMNVSFPFSCFF